MFLNYHFDTSISIAMSAMFAIIAGITLYYSFLIQKNRQYKALIVGISASGAGIFWVKNLLLIAVLYGITGLLSFALIVLQDQKIPVKFLIRYAIWHISAIIFFIIWIISVHSARDNLEIYNILQTFCGTDLSVLCFILISVGIPCCGIWFVKTYSYLDSPTFCFLPIIVTTIPIFIASKVILGIGSMQYIGIFMLFYNTFGAMLEEGIKRCILKIYLANIGFILICISSGAFMGKTLIFYILATNFSLYAMSVLYTYIIRDSDGKIMTFAHLSRYFNNKIFENGYYVPSIIFISFSTIGFPLTSVYFAKHEAMRLFSDNGLVYHSLYYSSLLSLLIALKFVIPAAEDVRFCRIPQKHRKLFWLFTSLTFMAFALSIAYAFVFHIPQMVVLISDTFKYIIVMPIFLVCRYLLRFFAKKYMKHVKKYILKKLLIPVHLCSKFCISIYGRIGNLSRMHIMSNSITLTSKDPFCLTIIIAVFLIAVGLAVILIIV